MLGVIKANNSYLDKIRWELLILALSQKDKPYVHGCHGPSSFDCAGLVWFLYNEILNIDLYELGFGISTTTMIMTSKYGKITLYEDSSLFKDLSNLDVGDILFFHRQAKNDNIPRVDNKYPGHCGLYLKDNYFIHCSGKYKKVTINNLDDDKYWRNILVGSKNIINEKVLKK